MAIDLVADAIGVLGYLGAFWLFLFSAKFRASTLDTWRARSGFAHVLTAIDIVVATICGLLPVGVVYWIVFR